MLCEQFDRSTLPNILTQNDMEFLAYYRHFYTLYDPPLPVHLQTPKCNMWLRSVRNELSTPRYEIGLVKSKRERY